MDNEELNAALYKKMFAEQEKYRDWLLGQPPEVIIDKAFEYASREDLLLSMEYNDLPDELAQALLDSDDAMKEVFTAFECRETGYMDEVFSCVESAAASLVRAKQLADQFPLYHETATYARDHNELDAYRASRKANIACKEAIEQAIGDHYADNRLDTAAAVKQVVDAFGYDRTMYVLAVTVQHKSWDGRISDSNKQWAASVPVIEDKTDGSADQNVFLVVGQAHPGLIDLFVRETRKAQARDKEIQRSEPKKEAEKPSIMERLKKPVQKNAPNNSAHLSRPEL